MKDQIMDAALKEFGEKPYDQASVNQIIAISQSSKGTFYHYFSSKEKLYLELITYVLEEKKKFISRIAYNAKDLKSDNIFELLKIQMKASIQFAVEYPLYSAFAIQVAYENNQILKDKTSTIISHGTQEFFKEIIIRNIEKGNIRRDIPIDFTIAYFTFMIRQFNELLKDMACEISKDNFDEIMKKLDLYIEVMKAGLQ